MIAQSNLQKWAFWIDPETKAMLQTLAKQEKRSQSATLRILIQNAHDARRIAKKSAAAPKQATAHAG